MKRKENFYRFRVLNKETKQETHNLTTWATSLTNAIKKLKKEEFGYVFNNDEYEVRYVNMPEDDVHFVGGKYFYGPDSYFDHD